MARLAQAHPPLCRAAKVALFFKQLGATRKDLTGRELDGRIYNEFPKFRPAESQRQLRVVA
jgi:protein gp37